MEPDVENTDENTLEEAVNQPQVAPPQKHMHELTLHEVTHQGALEILRVPGGWVYTWAYGDQSKLEGVAMIFVPYSSEFDPNKVEVPAFQNPADIIPGD